MPLLPCVSSRTKHDQSVINSGLSCEDSQTGVLTARSMRRIAACAVLLRQSLIIYVCIYIYILGAGHRVSRPRGTGSVGDSVGEGRSLWGVVVGGVSAVLRTYETWLCPGGRKTQADEEM